MVLIMLSRTAVQCFVCHIHPKLQNYLTKEHPGVQFTWDCIPEGTGSMEKGCHTLWFLHLSLYFGFGPLSLPLQTVPCLFVYGFQLFAVFTL